jgi:hypothetical protein
MTKYRPLCDQMPEYRLLSITNALHGLQKTRDSSAFATTFGL